MLEKSGLRSGTAKSGFGFSQALLTAFAITIPAMFILAAILTFTDFPEKYKTIAVLIATLSSLFVARFKTGVHNEKRMIRGALTGLYICLYYILRAVSFLMIYFELHVRYYDNNGYSCRCDWRYYRINRKSKPLSRVNRLAKEMIFEKYRR